MKKILSIITLLATIFTICVVEIPVSAANVCYDIRGNLTKTTTFNVNVGKKIFATEQIILTQNQGQTLQSWYGKTKTCGMYGRYYISVYDNTSKKWVYSNEKWKSKTFKIKSSKLKKGHSYTITVAGDMNQYVLDSYSKAPYVFQKWYSYPTWSATKTGKNITFCGY